MIREWDGDHLFHCAHSGNKKISLSDHLIPLCAQWNLMIRESLSEMERFPLYEGNKMIRERDGEILTVRRD